MEQKYLPEAFLAALEKERERVPFHSLVVFQHDKELLNLSWEGYSSSEPHVMYSVTKSFTSAAAGFAVSEGKIRWDTSIAELLPEELPQGREEEFRGVTLEVLLCMGSGLHEDSDLPFPELSVSWARHILSYPLVYPPMSHFHYNTSGSYLVSCMLQKATGQNLRDYLTPRLFEPLGIQPPKWDTSPEGICMGGDGMYLSANDLAKYGLCLLHQGQWNGKQVLPEGWVTLATRKHIDTVDPDVEWQQGYAFHFWRGLEGRYRMAGSDGQVCMIDEKRDALVAATCLTDDMAEEFRFLGEELFPTLDTLSFEKE